eukprot:COSAG01_NODE_387_length_17738_cov_14.410171_12_plen_206_part_00
MSRATNSFHHIRANAAGADASKQSDALRVAISGAITVLAKALDGSVALEDIEKAVFDLTEQHPPTLMFSEVEVELCSMVRTIVLAGNATLKAEMTQINPRAVGELPESLVTVVRECLDHFMLTSEQRTQDALISLQQLLQEKCAEPDPAMEDQVGTLKTNINDLATHTARTASVLSSVTAAGSMHTLQIPSASSTYRGDTVISPA